MKNLFRELRTDNEQMCSELRRLEKVNRELREKVIKLKAKNKENADVNRNLQETIGTMVADRQSSERKGFMSARCGSNTTVKKPQQVDSAYLVR